MEVRNYESVVIFKSNLNDSQLKDEIKRVEGILTSNQATVSKVDNLGRKELAYNLNKQRHGVYVVYTYQSANYEVPNALQSVLRISDAVAKFETHIVKTKTRKFKGNPKRLLQPRTDSDDFDYGDSYE
jgi:small subunit ribosomal protein S6